MALLDLLIRNQFLLLLFPAIILLVLSVVRRLPSIRTVHYRNRSSGIHRKTRDPPSNYRKMVLLALKWFPPAKLSLAIGFLSLSLLVAGFGRFSPISQATALPLPPPVRELPDNKSLLIFLHGWDGDPLDTWKDFPRLVLGDTTFDSFNIRVVSYPTYYARRNLGIRSMARWLNDRFDRDGIYAQYESIWIVGHSMGGLIGRELLIANRLQRDNKKFRLLIEIASPHQGASIAPLAKALGVSRGFVEDLTPRSPFLFTLRDDWNALKDRPKTFCLTSPHDQIVSIDSAIAQCDDYLQYPQWGHIEMVKPLDARDERYRVPMSRVKGI